MGFLKKNPERISATREFCLQISQKPDPLGAVLLEISDLDERVVWTVVAEALRQSITLPVLALLIQNLRSSLPGKTLWNLPSPKEQLTANSLRSQPWLNGWALESHLHGILTSVGLWVRSTGNAPHAHVLQSNMSQLWREFSKIYFMGKSNRVRPKVLSLLFRLSAPEPMGLGLPIIRDPLASGNSWPLPVYNGTRKWLKLLGPNPQIWMEKHDELERLQYFQKMFAGINSTSPDRVAYGLSIFLEQQGTDLLCRTLQEGCLHCALAAMNPIAGACPGRRV